MRWYDEPQQADGETAGKRKETKKTDCFSSSRGKKTAVIYHQVLSAGLRSVMSKNIDLKKRKKEVYIYS